MSHGERENSTLSALGLNTQYGAVTVNDSYGSQGKPAKAKRN
jgi:hypothetical protein